jgi:glutaredoxin
MPTDVERLANGQKIELYVKPGCPSCAQAQSFYRGKGIAFASHDAQNDPEARKRMLAFSGGDRTVPVIVVDGTYAQSGWGRPPRG